MVKMRNFLNTVGYAKEVNLLFKHHNLSHLTLKSSRVSFLVVRPKLCLEIINNLFVNLEGLMKDIIGCISNGDDTRVVTAKPSNCNCICLSHIELEVNEAYREHEHISLVDDLGDKFVDGVRGDKADIQGTL